MDQDFITLKDIKPALSAYIAEARSLLRKSPVPDDDSVHDMRVLLKKARAALKLIGPQVDTEYNHNDIPDLKEAAGIMSAWRDSTVYRKTLKELRKDFPEVFKALAENEKILNLLKKPEHAAEPSPEISGGVERIDSLLKKTGYRIRLTNMKNPDPQELLRELEKTYLLVVEAFLDCRNNPKAVKLHRLRKKTKDLLYQLYFFRPVNSRHVRDLEKKLRDLTRNLGRINDLAQIMTALGYRYPDQSNTPALNELAVRIRERQDKYLSKVWPVASGIFIPGKNLWRKSWNSLCTLYYEADQVKIM